MHTALEHLSAVELEQCLPDVLASPADNGRLISIFVRPAPNERRALTTALLSPERGIEGDRWVRDSGHKSHDEPDPRCQVSLMNSRYLRTIAGNDEAMCLAGDNLIIDLDLSEANLPAGSQLAIGDNVIIEITDLSHTGCGKFQNRYGKEVRTFTNNERGKALHLRGRYARIVTAGTINVGDSVRKTHPRGEAM
jgi:MOSC domain-containing protein YiiM